MMFNYMKYSNILNDWEDVTTMRPFYGILNKIKVSERSNSNFSLQRKLRKQTLKKFEIR